jgi:hypothetical protein
MTDRIPQPESEFEDEGIPDPEEFNPEAEATGDTGYGLSVPGTRSVGVEEFGTTAREEREGEGLDRRVSHEEPEVYNDAAIARDPGGDDLETPFHDPESVGRLVDDDEGAHEDVNSELTAHEYDADGGETAEESAMHIVPEEG